MRERRTERTGYRLAARAVLALCMLWVLLSGSVFAENVKNGSLTVQVPKDAVEGTEISVYRVADYNGSVYTFTKDFEKSGIVIENLNDSKKAQDAAKSAAEFAAGKKLKAQAAKKADKTETVNFASLQAGIYLVMQTAGSDTIKLQPALVPIPYAGSEGWIYDASISPKASYPTGAVIAKKVNKKNGKDLADAHFVLQQKTYLGKDENPANGETVQEDKGGRYYWKEFKKDLKSSKAGQIVVYDMPFGSYRFIETQAPKGFILDKTPHEFEISKGGEVKEVKEVWETASGTVVELTINNVPEEEETETESESESENETESETGSVKYKSGSGSSNGTSGSSGGSKSSNGSVKTGDDTPIRTWLAVFGIAAVIVIVLLIVRRKKKQK
ncbi:MAG: SpaA isopeptide-forming pilin-related protein [Eubacteriales bacterium]|nr:SpaA isopeptide-forming pilin-related protein [Eubacteriales bacterium]